ncbi:metal ABC transporter permease [Weissella confusa]|uniref:Metal ABC transporter permease n=1 Tax=Weissella confusa TaxID=1583 RepID=A0A923SMN8_WEICO|nr:metal ABC transporter permease [Weissella confusa]
MLFGSIFSISRVDVIEVVVLALLVLLASLLMFRQLRHYAFDYDTAVFSLKNIQLIEVAFLGCFAGASFALFMSWSPLVGMLLFSVVASMTVGELGIKEKRSESLISAVSAVAIGLGIAFLSLSNKNATKVVSLVKLLISTFQS